jgi:hemophore-related protein
MTYPLEGNLYMIKLPLARLAVAVGVSALSLGVGAGVAYATPDLGPAINTTCSYPQLVSALNAQNPEAGRLFSSSPIMQSALQDFLASGPDARRTTAEYVVNAPAVRPYLGSIELAFNTCNGF